MFALNLIVYKNNSILLLIFILSHNIHLFVSSTHLEYEKRKDSKKGVGLCLIPDEYNIGLKWHKFYRLILHAGFHLVQFKIYDLFIYGYTIHIIYTNKRDFTIEKQIARLLCNKVNAFQTTLFLYTT